MSLGAPDKLPAPHTFSRYFSAFLFSLFSLLSQVNLDKLYILTVNHVFKNKLIPLLLDQTKRSQAHGPSRDTNSVIQSIFKHSGCIQNLELAAATMHKIAQDLPAGQSRSPGGCFIYCFFALNHSNEPLYIYTFTQALNQ